ncbi:MAG: hypothetical protein LBG59_01765 [Candidatus Peribacteria bacterium]|nr:hypothetical protein [Candidatus Peribacteria bacterium]
MGTIIGTFKGNITKYAQHHCIPFLRQSRYYDHIVRDEIAYNRIKHYIRNNPKKWAEDKLFSLSLLR